MLAIYRYLNLKSERGHEPLLGCLQSNKLERHIAGPIFTCETSPRKSLIHFSVSYT